MDYEFSSREELYSRVKPALMAKYQEFLRLGFYYIKEVDIWNYLINTKWRLAKDLMLVDIVNDIMNLDIKILDNYIKSKFSQVKREVEIYDEVI